MNLADDGDNTAINNSVISVIGLSRVIIAAGSTITVTMEAAGSTDYTLTVFSEVYNGVIDVT